MGVDLKSLSFGELEGVAEQFGQPKYTAKYIFNFVQAKWVKDISSITPLSKAFRAKLGEEGLDIPGDIFILSFDDFPYSVFLATATGAHRMGGVIPCGTEEVLIVSDKTEG